MITMKTPSPSKHLQNTFMKAHLHAFTPPICKGGEVKVVTSERLHLHEVCECCICLDNHYDLACLCRGGCGSLVGFPLSWKLDTTATTTEIERLAWCSKCAAVLSAEDKTSGVRTLPDNSNAATGQPEGKARDVMGGKEVDIFYPRPLPLEQRPFVTVSMIGKK